MKEERQRLHDAKIQFDEERLTSARELTQLRQQVDEERRRLDKDRTEQNARLDEIVLQIRRLKEEEEHIRHDKMEMEREFLELEKERYKCEELSRHAEDVRRELDKLNDMKEYMRTVWTQLEEKSVEVKNEKRDAMLALQKCNDQFNDSLRLKNQMKQQKMQLETAARYQGEAQKRLLQEKNMIYQQRGVLSDRKSCSGGARPGSHGLGGSVGSGLRTSSNPYALASSGPHHQRYSHHPGYISPADLSRSHPQQRHQPQPRHHGSGPQGGNENHFYNFNQQGPSPNQSRYQSQPGGNTRDSGVDRNPFAPSGGGPDVGAMGMGGAPDQNRWDHHNPVAASAMRKGLDRSPGGMGMGDSTDRRPSLDHVHDPVVGSGAPSTLGFANHSSIEHSSGEGMGSSMPASRDTSGLMPISLLGGGKDSTSDVTNDFSDVREIFGVGAPIAAPNE